MTIIGPGLLEGLMEGDFYIRDVAAWDTVAGARTAGDIPLATRVSGDILLVFGASRENTALDPTNAGWQAVDFQSGVQNEIWARVATADSNDAFTAPSLSDAGQENSAYQMCALKTPMADYPVMENNSANHTGGKNYKMLGSSHSTTANTDRLIIARSVKVWDPNQYSGALDGIPGGETADGMLEVDTVLFDRGSTMTMGLAWSVRWDATGAAIAAIDYKQNPEYDPVDAGKRGGLYSKTIRCYENP